MEGTEVEVVESGEIVALGWALMAQQIVGAAPGQRASDKPPTVRFISPVDGQTLTGEVSLQVQATDDKGVVSVAFYYQEWTAFYQGGAKPILLGVDLTASDGWSIIWSTPNYGDAHYILWAEATDTKGQKASHNIAVFVDNIVGEPPEYSPDRWSALGVTSEPVAPIGVSIGNQYELAAGTLGCRVKDAQGRRYILSNNHVMARENLAKVGEWIFQPGLYDTGGGIPYAWQRVGVLSKFVPITFSRVASNQVDGAIAAVDSAFGALLVDVSTPPAGYGTPLASHLTNQALAALFAGGSFEVQKFGRTTGLTRGMVTSINTTILVTYSRGTARFVNQIVVSQPAGNFIKAGDSGSLLVTCGDPSREIPAAMPVELLFAGNCGGTMGVANRIEDVLTALGVTIDGQ